MPIGAFLVLLGFMSGGLIASQGAINGRLAGYAGGPLPAALISFTVGWITLMLMNLLTRRTWPASDQFAGAPWWIWIGGAVGALMVSSAAFAVPRIGIATWVSAVIAGQLISALLLDHIGAFGQTVREITPMRLVGAAFLATGVILIRKF